MVVFTVEVILIVVIVVVIKVLWSNPLKKCPTGWAGWSCGTPREQKSLSYFTGQGI